MAFGGSAGAVGPTVASPNHNPTWQTLH